MDTTRTPWEKLTSGATIEAFIVNVITYGTEEDEKHDNEAHTGRFPPS